MFLRYLGIVSLIFLVPVDPLMALEPVRSEGFLNEMVNRVVRGERIAPGRDLGHARPAKAYALAPIPINAVGRRYPASLVTVPAAADAGKPQTRPAKRGVAKQPGAGSRHARVNRPSQPLPAPLEKLIGAPLRTHDQPQGGVKKPRIRAKALYCVDCTSNKVVLAKNVTEPLPIASITKLLTAMTVIDEMDLTAVVTIPKDIRQVPQKRVGIRPGDRITVKDLLHGMLIESGNDCAEALARAYPKGGKREFMRLMNRKAAAMGAPSTRVYTPSGLDLHITIGRKDGRALVAKRSNIASAQDVAKVARKAFTYPLIRQISSMKQHVMRSRKNKWRKYVLQTNDKLLNRPLPVAGAKTGYTNLAGRCIVAKFKDDDKDYLVVVLNTPRHFKAAESIYRWAVKTF